MPFFRIQRHNLPGYAALATLCLLAVALLRGRFKFSYVLLHVAVALAERWQDRRAMARVADALATVRPEPVWPEGELWKDRDPA